MKKMKGRTRGVEDFSGNGAVKKNGAIRQSASAPVFKHPKTDLEAAIQRMSIFSILRPSATLVLTASVTLKRSTLPPHDLSAARAID